MRNTRREQADRRHLLRDLELFLELDPCGDVLHDDHRPAGVAIGSDQRSHGHVREQSTTGLAFGRRVAGNERNPVEDRPSWTLFLRRAEARHECFIEQRFKTLSDSPLTGNAIQPLETCVPSNDSAFQVEYDQPIAQRLDNVLAELTHPVHLCGLELKLTVETPVLECCRDLTRHGREQRHVLAAQWLPATFPPQGDDRNRPLPCHARYEVAETLVAPE